MKILVVEDNVKTNADIKKVLEDDNYIVESVYDGEEASEKFSYGEFDLVLLDLNLPGELDGFDLLKDFIKRKPDIKILILTANHDVSKVIQALNLGARDYLRKPIYPIELEARVNACFRTHEKIANSHLYEYPSFVYDAENFVLSSGDKAITLANKQADILKFFLDNPDVPITKEDLVCEVWGELENFASTYSNTIGVQISILKKTFINLIGFSPIEKSMENSLYKFNFDKAQLKK